MRKLITVGLVSVGAFVAAAGMSRGDAHGGTLALKPLTRLQATKIICKEWRAWSQTQGESYAPGFTWQPTKIHPVVPLPDGREYSMCLVDGFFNVAARPQEARMKVNVIQDATCRFTVNGGITVPNFPQGTFGLNFSRGRYLTTCAKLRR